MKFKIEIENGIAQKIEKTDKQFEGINIEGKTTDNVYRVKRVYIEAKNEQEALQIFNEIKAQYNIK